MPSRYNSPHEFERILVDYEYSHPDLHLGPGNALGKLIFLHENTLLHASEMESQALVDPLTKLPNERAAEKYYQGLQHSERQRREDDKSVEPVSIISFDLDNFKLINDTIGHFGGNEVLKQFASVLTHVRAGDFSSRNGGGSDEFKVILLNASEERAAKVAEKLLARANRAGIKVSAGVSRANLSETLASNERVADTALYEAKANGGNQVVRRSQLSEYKQNPELG